MTREEFRELEAGERFTVGYLELEVKEQRGCRGCFFYRKQGIDCQSEFIREIHPACAEEKREDGNSVIFVEVK